MKGLELLVIGEVFEIQTAYASYPNLKFMGFIDENDDVTLAHFFTADSHQFFDFDISVTSNRVINNLKEII